MNALDVLTRDTLMGLWSRNKHECRPMVIPDYAGAPLVPGSKGAKKSGEQQVRDALGVER